MQQSDITDQELVVRILRGEDHLFEKLLDRYRNQVAALIYSITGSQSDLEDIAQETFLTIYKNLPSFRGQSSLGTWIYRITVNKTRDWQRRHYLRRPVELLELTGLYRASPRQKLAFEEQEVIRDAIRQLPEKYRLVIVLYYFHDLSCREIAEVLALPKKTVETRLIRGRKRIEKMLDTGGEPTCTETRI